MSLIVHHLNNSRSQRILWLLEELGVDYTIQHYQLGGFTTLKNIGDNVGQVAKCNGRYKRQNTLMIRFGNSIEFFNGNHLNWNKMLSCQFPHLMKKLSFQAFLHEDFVDFFSSLNGFHEGAHPNQ